MIILCLHVLNKKSMISKSHLPQNYFLISFLNYENKNKVYLNVSCKNGNEKHFSVCVIILCSSNFSKESLNFSALIYNNIVNSYGNEKKKRFNTNFLGPMNGVINFRAMYSSMSYSMITKLNNRTRQVKSTASSTTSWWCSWIC